MTSEGVIAASELDRLFAWARYLYWCDLNRQRLDSHDDGAEGLAPDHPRRWLFIALLAHWYASLSVVIEGWRETKLSDPIIDDLLVSCPRLCDLLRRFRNGVYHYQPSLLDPKFLTFLSESETTYVWADLLHGEFCRYLWTWIHRVPEEVHPAFRQSVLDLIGWLPTDLPEERLRQAREYRHKVRRMLSESGDTSSAAARGLIEAAHEFDRTAQEGAEAFAKWRRELIAFVKARGT